MGALIQCPHCKQLFGLSDQQVPQYAGQTISCSQCQQAFTVPANLSPTTTQPEPAVSAVAAQPSPPPQAPPAPARVEQPVVAERKPVAPTVARPAPPPPAPPPRPQRMSPGGSHHGTPAPAAHHPAHPRDPHHASHAPPPVYPGAPTQPATRQPSVDQARPHTARRETSINSLAVASVVCGAVGLIPILLPSIIGLIVGIMGLRKANDPSVGGKGIAVTGICVSAASFVLFFGWLAYLVPQVNQRTENTKRLQCEANLKAIGQAVVAYTAQNQGAYPPRLEVLMISEKLSANLFVCPSSDDSPALGTDIKTQAQSLSSGAHLSYSYVGQRLSAGMPAARVVVLFEPLANHGQAGSNFLFGDGHVEWLTATQAEQAIPQIQNGINPPKY